MEPAAGTWFLQADAARWVGEAPLTHMSTRFIEDPPGGFIYMLSL